MSPRRETGFDEIGKFIVQAESRHDVHAGRGVVPAINAPRAVESATISRLLAKYFAAAPANRAEARHHLVGKRFQVTSRQYAALFIEGSCFKCADREKYRRAAGRVGTSQTWLCASWRISVSHRCLSSVLASVLDRLPR